MLHKIALLVALAVFGVGMIIKVSAWFRYSVGPQKADLRASRRIAAAVNGIVCTIFSPRVLRIIRTFFLEVIFQSKILKEDSLGWCMHMCIYGGFAILFFLHVLDNWLVVRFYPEYAATLTHSCFSGTRQECWLLSGSRLRFTGAFSGRPNARLRAAWTSP